MPDAIRQIVEQTWRTSIGVPPQWSEQQTRDFFDSEADRIAELIEEQMGGRGPLVAQWTAEHGHAPDYLTTVRLIETARRSITEVVLAEELYEKIPNQEDPFPPLTSVEQWDEEQQAQEEARLAEAAGDPDRWKHPLRRRDPEPLIAELARMLWADRSALFRVTGAFLLQARHEDNQPLPTGTSDPLAASFTNQVREALIEAGKPLDGRGKLVDR